MFWVSAWLNRSMDQFFILKTFFFSLLMTLGNYCRVFKRSPVFSAVCFFFFLSLCWHHSHPPLESELVKDALNKRAASWSRLIELIKQHNHSWSVKLSTSQALLERGWLPVTSPCLLPAAVNSIYTWFIIIFCSPIFQSELISFLRRVSHVIWCCRLMNI